MSDPGFIDRDRKLAQAQDYDALRAIGLARIQALSGKLWSDHNSHDPGITLLETLAYAVADLGYRTAFPTEDLLTRPDGLIGPASETGLFPAHEALTCSPLTIADHRQLLVRIRDVRNAWLDPMQDPDSPDYRRSEVPIYADCGNDRLTYDSAVDGKPTHPVRLSGLYRVLVALEPDDVLGSLDETALRYRFRADPLKGVVVRIDSHDPAFLASEIDFTADFVGLDGAPNVSGEQGVLTASVNIQPAVGPAVSFTELRLVVIEDRPRPTDEPVTVTAADLEAELARTDEDAILRRFWEKQQRRQTALANVCCVLNAHRPLCEDWFEITSAAPFRVGICADIDVTPDADLEQIQAEIFHAIEGYLNPPVPWRSLDALLDEGVPVDEIFNGPAIDSEFQCGGEAVFTKPGFLTREGLESCELRRSVHSSDIINLVVDIEGVLGVRGLTLRAYDADGSAIGESESWTLAVPPDHQPILDFDGSKVLLFKNELQFRARQTEFIRTLEHLRALSEAALTVPPGQVLPAVIGRWRALDRYHSIQNDLPRIYGTGPAGLAPQESAERVARARQLKGFLTHFDWLLADYLGQLANVRHLLSPDPTLLQSYFPHLFAEAAGTLEAFDDEYYIDKSRLGDPVARARLTESEETFLDRRSRALDHLLARFAERFADYALMRFRLAGDSLASARERIADKAAFLAEAPLLSRLRSQGFDDRPEDPSRVWNTDNVPGLQRRVARLLGIADARRRDLHCGELFGALIDTVEDGGAFRVRIATEDTTTLFESVETFASGDQAQAAAEPVFARLRSEQAFRIDDSGGVNAVRLELTDGAGTVLTHREPFETSGDAARRAREIVLRYDRLLHSAACDNEGLHVIEHILLRPRSAGDPLMQVCLPPDCAFCGEQDPYSFRLHVVLPYWPARFQDLAFRRYAERLIREETPAHIAPRICWVGNEAMRRLDLAWHGWLELNADPTAEPAARASALSTLIDALQQLRTVYPPATLHDCAEGEDENTVRLGTSTLGLF